MHTIDRSRSVTRMKTAGRALTFMSVALMVAFALIRGPHMLEVALVLVLVGVPMWVVGRRVDGDGSDSPRHWSRTATVLYWAEFAIVVIYIIASSGVILFAGGWHASEAQGAVLLGLVAGYLIGAPAILVWSLARWRRGGRSAYLIALLIPVLSLVILPLLRLAVVLFDLQNLHFG